MPGEGSSGRRLSSVLLVVALGLLVGAIYGRGRAFPFLRDDAIHFASKERWERPPARILDHFREEFWARGSRSGLYRPLVAATIQATRWVGGAEPAALRVGNAALLAAAALAAAALLRRLGGSRGASLLLALLIAAHPLLSETVMEIVSRSETSCALGVLVAACCLVGREGGRPAPLLAALAFLAALLSKEGAFAAFPALLLLAALRPPRPGPLRGFAALLMVGALGVALALRWRVFGGAIGLDPADVAKLDNPLVGEPPLVRTLTGVALLGRYLALLAWPAGLSADWSFAATMPLRAPGGWEFLAGAAALVVGVAWLGLAARGAARGQERRAELFGLLVSGGSWFLVSSIARPVGTIFAERLFTLPAIGILVALVAAADRTLRTRRAAQGVAAALAGACVLALAARGFVRVGDWRDARTLYEAAARVAPDSARVQCVVGQQLRLKGEFVDAKARMERAINILPDYAKAHHEMAGLFQASGAFGSAFVHLWLAARSPTHLPEDEAHWRDAAERLREDGRARAEFRRYGAELVARRSDQPLYLELGREIARMPP
jgi:tetratricopeptide (TPR) repeat protein